MIHAAAIGTIPGEGNRPVEIDIRPNPTPFNRPQVGWMDALSAREHLCITVLREKANRRLLDAAHDDVQILEQGKTRALEKGRRGFVAALRALHELLNGCLHGPEHVRRSEQTDHFKGANRLMHVLTGHAQLARIDRGQVCSPRGLSVPHIPFQRLVGDFQRLAQLIEHPSQRPQVRHTGSRNGPIDSVFNLHDWANSAS
ncbi:MAG TPA: hypothetical protein PLT46_00065 [Burkholderiaceae bacterium]|nr:hypothetical protein [Burkholderiaceae bacterium]